jgi:hypothetical protein
MQFSEQSPRRQVNVRIEYPIFNFLRDEAAHNGISITQLVKYYFIHGFNHGHIKIDPNKKYKSQLLIERARRKANE